MICPFTVTFDRHDVVLRRGGTIAGKRLEYFSSLAELMMVRRTYGPSLMAFRDATKHLTKNADKVLGDGDLGRALSPALPIFVLLGKYRLTGRYHEVHRLYTHRWKYRDVEMMHLTGKFPFRGIGRKVIEMPYFRNESEPHIGLCPVKHCGLET
ncbi:hypothetical protein BV898_11689 [Hypsibius exemplaris]|uniref:Uncharacterized protein n=1 Tax=Hypsibius exemplaris TaxID=2072580 RepID=A0A1W0WFY1_HYPEX|nr:hypothetical protein BV898_11689 [Hypsibius exemplaris]